MSVLKQICLTDEDANINLVLPNGKLIQLQYRVEGQSIDVVLPTNLRVTNWIGDDMQPAPAVHPLGTSHPIDHCRTAKQLVIDLDPAMLVPESVAPVGCD